MIRQFKFVYTEVYNFDAGLIKYVFDFVYFAILFRSLTRDQNTSVML